MSRIYQALPWAAMMLLIAIGEAYGFVAEPSARAMFAIIPALAVVSIYRSGACRLGTAK